MSRNYFYDRSLDFAQELLLKEEYLRELYDCTVKEVRARRSEGLRETAIDNPLWNLEPLPFNRDDSTLMNLAISARYKMWVAYEEGEYQRRLGLVEEVRKSLIASGSEAQNQRMFQRELQRAYEYYGKKDWDVACLLFNRLLGDYPYQQVDDILYYKAQACLQMQFLNQALEAAQQLIATCPNSQYRAPSYDLITAILERFGNGFQIRKIYSRYLQENAPGDPIRMGAVHVRAARSEMNLGHYDPAVEILSHVPIKSPYYLAAQYLLADCYTALEDWPQAVKVLTAMVSVEQKNMPYQRWRMLKDEARLKLAFIHYQWGDYEKATELFNQMKSNSPFYDRALMGKAWITFQLDDYESAINKTEEMLKIYPLSTEIYEANSLAGYCYEQLGQDNKAAAHFLAVLDAGAGRADLQSFIEERRRIDESMAELQAQEESVFNSGEEKVYSDYRRARNQLWICQQRIRLAELLQVNRSMRALVEERILMDSLIIEHGRLEEQVATRKNQSLIAQFLSIEDRIWVSMDHLKQLGHEQIKSTPLYYREAQIGYLNMRADSLATGLESEIRKITETTQSVEKLRRIAFASNNLDEYLKLGVRFDHLDQALNQTTLDQTMAKNSRKPVLRTRVDRWSDFSFNRYAMGGMNLEQLDRKYERLRQVDEFITTLDDMIAQKKKESVTLPSEGKQQQ